MAKEDDGFINDGSKKERRLALTRIMSFISKLQQFLIGADGLDDEENDPEIIAAKAILNQFKTFLKETPDFKVGDVDLFVQIVNRWFPNFERDADCKLDISELVAHQAISCTGVSLLLGIWYEQVFGITPVFMIDIGEEDQEPGKYAHTAVYLPEANYGLSSKFDGRAYPHCRDLKALSGDVYEYYLSSKLRKSHLPMSRNYRVYGNLAYIKLRWKALNQGNDH